MQKRQRMTTLGTAAGNCWQSFWRSCIHRKNFRIFFLLNIIFLHNSIFSQPVSDPIIIKGKTDQESSDSLLSAKKTGFNTTIDVSKQQGRFSSLPEILQREGGIRVRQFGGLGSYSTLSIRGTNPNQSKIFINGIPLQNAQTGEVNLADLPFEQLDKIEIYKTGTPNSLPGSNIGGGINLNYQKKFEKPITKIQMGGGSFNTGKLTVSHSQTSSGWSWNVFGLGEKSDQNFSFLNDKGTPFNPFDDTIDRRRNAQFQRGNGFFTASKEFEKTTFNFLLDVNSRNQGIPGSASNQTRKVERAYDRFTTGLSTETKEFIIENLKLETRSYFSGFRDQLFDPLSEFSSGTPNSKAMDRQFGANISLTLFTFETNNITRLGFGGERESFLRERFSANQLVSEREPGRFRNYRYANFENEIRLFSKKLSIVPGISFNYYKDQFSPTSSQDPANKVTSFLNPKFGISYAAISDSKWELIFKGNASRENRIPNFLELFGERGQITANTNLRPEKANSYDLGFTLSKMEATFKTSIEVSLYRKTIVDMILFLPNSQFTLRADNVDSASIRGAEVFWKNKWKDAFRLDANLQYNQAINNSSSPFLNGKYLPLRPLWQGGVVTSYAFGSFEAGYEFTYIGANFRDRTNDYLGYQPSRSLHNLFFFYSLWKKEEEKQVQSELRINFEVKNVSDVKAFDYVGYPLPGRMWFANVQYSF